MASLEQQQLPQRGSSNLKEGSQDVQEGTSDNAQAGPPTPSGKSGHQSVFITHIEGASICLIPGHSTRTATSFADLQISLHSTAVW